MLGGLGEGFVWGCVNVCWVLGSGDLWCFYGPPSLSGGSALSCDRAGQPLGRAGRFGGRPGCGWGVAGVGGCVQV